MDRLSRLDVIALLALVAGVALVALLSWSPWSERAAEARRIKTSNAAYAAERPTGSHAFLPEAAQDPARYDVAMACAPYHGVVDQRACDAALASEAGRAP